jgi:hypothetical protein
MAFKMVFLGLNCEFAGPNTALKSQQTAPRKELGVNF